MSFVSHDCKSVPTRMYHDVSQQNGFDETKNSISFSQALCKGLYSDHLN